MMKHTYQKAQEFIYRNARPLDFARWQYHFENGSKEAILRALSYYQNSDGGFGHALELDCWNPNSSPIGTCAAIQRLKEIDFDDATHPLVLGILNYLDSGVDFNMEYNQWLNVLPTNNDYPHACWWEYGAAGSEFKYNPTAVLAGFIIQFADKNSNLYQKGIQIVKEAVSFLENSISLGEQHVTGCFVTLYDYCHKAKVDFIDMERFKNILTDAVNYVICREPDKWFTQYLPKPSDYIKSKDSIFYEGNEELVRKECELIIARQEADGSYPVTWNWGRDYAKEFVLSENWWKSELVINNMLFLRAFGFI